MVETKVGVKTIFLNRAEGPVAAVGSYQRTVTSFAAAEGVLREWSRTAPRHGGYDKIDFEITFHDGETYQGRYDLSYNRDQDAPTLAEHVRRFVHFYSDTMTLEQLPKRIRENGGLDTYHRMVNEQKPELVAEYKVLLEQYDLEN